VNEYGDAYEYGLEVWGCEVRNGLVIDECEHGLEV